MLQYSFDLDRFHPRKDGTCCLKAKIYRSRTDYVFIALKIYLLPTEWDGKKIVHSVTAALDNARLNNYRLTVGKLLLDIDESGENPAMSEIRARVEVALSQRQQRPDTFFAYAEEYISKVPTRRTRENFCYAIKKVRAYDPVDRSFSDITAGWVRGFESFCRNDGMSVNGAWTYLKNIRTIYNRAIDDNIAQFNDYPFRRFGSGRSRRANVRSPSSSCERYGIILARNRRRNTGISLC